MAGDLTLREPARENAPAMASLMVRGNSTYREFAPRLWQPPRLERTQSQWYLRLREADRWTRVAVGRDDDLVAFASWRPARAHGEEGAEIPGIGYVSHLYVHPDRWDNGIARGLLALAEAAMSEAGYSRAILWTPAPAPARIFYERCGWHPDGREQWSTELQLPMVGYEKHL